MPLPSREYLSLEMVSKRWGTEISDVEYSLFHDNLPACCWFDNRKIDYYELKGASPYEEWFCGYAGLYAHDCRRIFRPGDIYVNRFYVLDGGEAYFHIAQDQKAALIHPDQVMIRLCDCKVFEKYFDLIATECVSLVIQDTYTFYYNGNLLSFGVVQQEVVRLLIEAQRRGMPWVHGKILLQKAGAQAPRLRDLFKGNTIWRDLIQSDKHGHYRLHENILVEYAYTKEKAA